MVHEAVGLQADAAPPLSQTLTFQKTCCDDASGCPL